MFVRLLNPKKGRSALTCPDKGDLRSCVCSLTEPKKGEVSDNCPLSALTPSLPQPAKKIQAERCTDAPANSLFSGPVTHLLSMLCVVIKSFHMPVRKENRKASNFAFSLAVFKATSSQ